MLFQVMNNEKDSKEIDPQEDASLFSDAETFTGIILYDGDTVITSYMQRYHS